MQKHAKPLPPFRRSIRSLEAYRVARPPHRVKLDQNESPVELPAAVRRRILAALAKKRWSRYPDFPPEHLARKIAERERVPAGSVLVGHGSNELLYAAALATLEMGSVMILPTPSYGVAHLAARLAGGRALGVPLDDDFAYSPERIVAAARREKARLLFLPSPNNPTGSLLSKADVRTIAESVRSLVIVDEAYRDFAQVRLAPLLARHRNLVLLRTFSKAFRLAGLRIGYLLGDEEALLRIERAKPPHSVDVFSQVAAEIALDEEPRIRKGVLAIVRERERIAATLRPLESVRVYPSEANFLLVRVPDGERVFRRLLSAGVLVRFVGLRAAARGSPRGIPIDPRLRNCLRVTVGTRAENDRFLAAFREAIEERG